MFTSVEDITIWCARYGSCEYYLEQRQNNTELVIPDQFFFFRKRMAMDLLSQFSSQIGNSCEMSVPPEVFWGNIPFRHHELVVAKKRQVFWTKLAKLQNTKGLKTDKSRWQQDHWLHFPCWHWSSEVEYAQAWQKHYELSSPSLDLEGVVPLTMSSSS